MNLEENDLKNIIDLENKKKMLPLTKEELKPHQDAKVCYICEQIILKKLSKSKNYWKVRDLCHNTSKYSGAAYSIFILKFNMLNEIPLAFHNGSNRDYQCFYKRISKRV